MKAKYIVPRTKPVLVYTNENILADSAAGITSSGENVSQDSEYNPW
ncbi:MAG: hypothetical protein J5693_04690 [Bacteroidales bacterium]|nr:hypothetical protein [Bacteroidales bacterium]